MVITPILAKETEAQRGPVPAQMALASRATESSSMACLLCMWSVCSELEGVVVCMGGGSPVLNLLSGLGEWSRVQAEADGGGYIDHMWPGDRETVWWLPHITWGLPSLGIAVLSLVTQQLAQRRVCLR